MLGWAGRVWLNPQTKNEGDVAKARKDGCRRKKSPNIRWGFCAPSNVSTDLLYRVTFRSDCRLECRWPSIIQDKNEAFQKWDDQVITLSELRCLFEGEEASTEKHDELSTDIHHFVSLSSSTSIRGHGDQSEDECRHLRSHIRISEKKNARSVSLSLSLCTFQPITRSPTMTPPLTSRCPQRLIQTKYDVNRDVNKDVKRDVKTTFLIHHPF